MGTRFNRRAIVRAGLAVAVAPAVLRHARGDAPIKIGMPLALTGPAAEIGEQMRHGAEFWAKTVNAKGGLLSRPSPLSEETKIAFQSASFGTTASASDDSTMPNSR